MMDWKMLSREEGWDETDATPGSKDSVGDGRGGTRREAEGNTLWSEVLAPGVYVKVCRSVVDVLPKGMVRVAKTLLSVGAALD